MIPIVLAPSRYKRSFRVTSDNGSTNRGSVLAAPPGSVTFPLTKLLNKPILPYMKAISNETTMTVPTCQSTVPPTLGGVTDLANTTRSCEKIHSPTPIEPGSPEEGGLYRRVLFSCIRAHQPHRDGGLRASGRDLAAPAPTEFIANSSPLALMESQSEGRAKRDWR